MNKQLAAKTQYMVLDCNSNLNNGVDYKSTPTKHALTRLGLMPFAL